MPGKGDFIQDGYALEHRVVGYLESNGWFPVKSHMSRGIVDVMAVKPGGQVRFVQCKLSKWGGEEFDDLKELNERFEDATIEYVTLKESNELEFRDIEEMTDDFNIDDYDNLENNSDIIKVQDFIENHTPEENDSLFLQVVKAEMSDRLDKTEDEIEEMVERLKREGELFEPEEGKVQSI